MSDKLELVNGGTIRVDTYLNGGENTQLVLTPQGVSRRVTRKLCANKRSLRFVRTIRDRRTKVVMNFMPVEKTNIDEMIADTLKCIRLLTDAFIYEEKRKSQSKRRRHQRYHARQRKAARRSMIYPLPS